MTSTTDITNTLTEHSAAIRALGKRAVADVIEIGRHLAEARKVCGHGNWLPWLKSEFGWTEQTALNFIRAHELAKSKNFLDLNLPVSSLYLLAAPSTSEAVRTAIIEQAKTCTPVSVAKVKDAIATAKGHQQPAKKKRRTPDDFARDMEAKKAAASGDRPAAVPERSLEAQNNYCDGAGADAAAEVASPEEIKSNIFDTIERQKAVARAYKKIFLVSDLDQVSKDEVSEAIGTLIATWQSLQKALAPKLTAAANNMPTASDDLDDIPGFLRRPKP